MLTKIYANYKVYQIVSLQYDTLFCAFFYLQALKTML